MTLEDITLHSVEGLCSVLRFRRLVQCQILKIKIELRLQPVDGQIVFYIQIIIILKVGVLRLMPKDLI